MSTYRRAAGGLLLAVTTLIGLQLLAADPFEQSTKVRFFNPETESDVRFMARFVMADWGRVPPETKQFVEQSKQFQATDDSQGDSLSASFYYADGLLRRVEGDHEGALALFRKAIHSLERDRRKLRNERVASGFVEPKLGVYYAAIEELLDQRRYAEAFELMEQSRSRALADILDTREIRLAGETERKLYAESAGLRAQIASSQTELARSIRRGDSPEVRATIHNEIAASEEADRKLQMRISREAPKLLELRMSKPISLAALQLRMKNEGFEVLEYLVTDTGIILWHIDPGDVQVKYVFLPRTELLRKVEALRESLSKHAVFDHKAARQLFLFLIQPALGLVRSDRLVVIPHDALNSIPFQVLENPATGISLGERYQLSYAPSASVYARLRTSSLSPDSSVIALADPEIPQGVEEVKRIAELYPTRSKIITETLVGKSTLAEWTKNRDVIHLSVHGRFSGQEPLLSYLKLAKDKGDDERLTAAEMFGLQLSKINLVVLSACETGKMEASPSNEVPGMIPALLYAGAGALVLTSWEVEAESTALWMKTFYSAARTNPLPEAARRALVAVKNHPDFAHPYHWGAYMLVAK